jgi:hypothetical protein
MVKFIVYFKKHFSGMTMRFGVYDTFEAAAKAKRDAESFNEYDVFYIEQKYVNEG